MRYTPVTLRNDYSSYISVLKNNYLSKISRFIIEFFLRLRDGQNYARSCPSHTNSKETKVKAKNKDIWEYLVKKYRFKNNNCIK